MGRAAKIIGRHISKGPHTHTNETRNYIAYICMYIHVTVKSYNSCVRSYLRVKSGRSQWETPLKLGRNETMGCDETTMAEMFITYLEKKIV